jgi:hypothetical protein
MESLREPEKRAQVSKPRSAELPLSSFSYIQPFHVGVNLPPSGNDAMDQFIREKNLRLEIQKVKVGSAFFFDQVSNTDLTD